MREIKFRAWDKICNKWITESYGIFLDGMMIRYDRNAGEEDERVFRTEVDLKNIGWGENAFKDIEIMQFIGLKDKNGKDIYEGDIVKVHKFTQEIGENMGVVEGEKEFVAEIIFSPYGGVYLEAGEHNSGALWLYEDGFHEESIEVIGNIYENPELLEIK